MTAPRPVASAAIDIPGTVSGATVVISHRVKPYQDDGYLAWLATIEPRVRGAAGFLDVQIIRPIADLTAIYTIILRFDTREHLEAWMHSDERSRLIDLARPLLATDDDFCIRSGLDFWFLPGEAKAKIPPRWKQFVLSWSAIFPLVLTLPQVVVPRLLAFGLPDWHPLHVLIITGMVVALMIYVVMPRYTRLVKGWLFSSVS